MALNPAQSCIRVMLNIDSAYSMTEAQTEPLFKKKSRVSLFATQLPFARLIWLPMNRHVDALSGERISPSLT